MAINGARHGPAAPARLYHVLSRTKQLAPGLQQGCGLGITGCSLLRLVSALKLPENDRAAHRFEEWARTARGLAGAPAQLPAVSCALPNGLSERRLIISSGRSAYTVGLQGAYGLAGSRNVTPLPAPPAPSLPCARVRQTAGSPGGSARGVQALAARRIAPISWLAWTYSLPCCSTPSFPFVVFCSCYFPPVCAFLPSNHPAGSRTNYEHLSIMKARALCSSATREPGWGAEPRAMSSEAR